MSAALAWPFVVLGVLAVGAVILRELRAGPPGPSWLGLGITSAAGLSATLLLLYLPVSISGSVSFAPTLALHAVCLGLCVPRLRGALSAARRTRVGPALLLAALGLLMFVDTGMRRPFSNYDSKAIYALKAKALLHEGELDIPLFTDPDVVHYHADYPLGVPLLMAYTGWLAQGGALSPRSEQPAQLAEWVERHGAVESYMGVTVLWVVGLASLIGACVLRSTRRVWPRVLLFVCAVPLAWIAPWDLGASWRATAETPLALCVGACALALAALLRTERATPDAPDATDATQVMPDAASAANAADAADAADVPDLEDTHDTQDAHDTRDTPAALAAQVARETPATAASTHTPAAAWMPDAGWTSSSRALIGALALIAAAGPLLKSDSFIGLAALALAWVWTARGRLRLRGARALLVSLLPGVLLVALGRRFIVGAPFDEAYLAALLDGDVGLWFARLSSLPGAIVDALLHTHLLPFWSFAVLVAVPLGWRSRNPSRRLLARALVLHLLACCAIFLVTPNLQSWHVYYALPRLWSQMAVPAGVLVVGALVQLIQPAARRVPGRIVRSAV